MTLQLFLCGIGSPIASLPTTCAQNFCFHSGKAVAILMIMYFVYLWCSRSFVAMRLYLREIGKCHLANLQSRCRCQLPFHCCLWLWFHSDSFKDEVPWVRLPGKVFQKKHIEIHWSHWNTLLRLAQAHAGHGHMSSCHPRLRPRKGGPTPVQQCGLGDTPGSSYTALRKGSAPLNRIHQVCIFDCFYVLFPMQLATRSSTDRVQKLTVRCGWLKLEQLGSRRCSRGIVVKAHASVVWPCSLDRHISVTLR